MENLIVRYGDSCLKGKNKNFFIKMGFSLIKEKLEGLDVEARSFGDRAYVNTKDVDVNTVIDRLNHVSGLYSYSIYEKCEKNIEPLKELALKTYDEYHKDGESFKISSRRIDKKFEPNSYGIMRELSAHILKNRSGCIVDVHHPDLEIEVEVREDAIYVLTDKQFKGLGGYPTGTCGKALVMMSGGIDSPVAAFELIKQGMTVELIHFESTPLTSIESAQKVVDLAKKLTAYTRGSKIILHMIPFSDVHNEILSKVDEEYLITIMRRCMYKIASKLAYFRHIIAIGNGESLGQVASQTIESMSVINDVTNMPVLRPLLTMDKKEIIKISEKIDCFNISIRPFEDCCTVYVPKNPVIKPTLEKALEEESKGDFDRLIDEAVKNTKRITIKSDTDIDLASLGFTVKEAIEQYLENKKGE